MFFYEIRYSYIADKPGDGDIKLLFFCMKRLAGIAWRHQDENPTGMPVFYP
jgi:hypothetical protein